MIEKLSSALSGYIINNGGDKNQQEIYEYSISSFLSSVITYGAILIISAIFGLWPDILIFLAFFLPLRYCIGGCHAKTRLGCFILSITITIALLFIAPYFNRWLLLPAPIIALIAVFAIAPVINPNHPLSEGYIKKVKKVAKLIILLECIILAAVYFISGHFYYNIGALGMLTAVISAILAYITSKNISN